MAEQRCPPTCECGLIFACLEPRGELHALDELWLLNAKLTRKDPCEIVRTNRPCLVLATRPHIEILEDLDERRAPDLGLLIWRIAREIRTLAKAERVSVLYLNVGTPRHVHMHFVPHFAADPNVNGLQLLEAALPAGVATLSGVEVASQIAAKLAT